MGRCQWEHGRMTRRQRELDSGFYREDGYIKISLREGKGFTPIQTFPHRGGRD